METINISEAEAKTSKAGKSYYRFNTSEGWMSCFEEDLIADLKKCLGSDVPVEWKERNGFKNIVAMGVSSSPPQEKAVAVAKTAIEPFSVARQMKDTSIYTSYSKDLLIKMLDVEDPTAYKSLNELMGKAIDLIKQARDAFE